MRIEELRDIIKKALLEHDESLFTITTPDDQGTGNLSIQINGADYNQHFVVNVSLDISPEQA